MCSAHPLQISLSWRSEAPMGGGTGVCHRPPRHWQGATSALSSKSTSHFMLIVQLSYHSCLVPQMSMVTPRAWNDTANSTSHCQVPLTKPKERVWEGSKVFKGKDYPHTVGLWLTYVALTLGKCLSHITSNFYVFTENRKCYQFSPESENLGIGST